jgi:uncharacterized protein with GYD domain
MPTFVVLGRYTEQGGRNIADALNRRRVVEQAIEQAGGKMLSWHMTLGEYDLVTIIDVPSDEVVLRLALEVAKVGSVKTTTLRAFGVEEVDRALSGMR